MSSLAQRNRNLSMGLLASVLGMLLLSYAAVPLYRMFCQVTGFGGTTREASVNSVVNSVESRPIFARKIKIHFNSDIDPKLPWHFSPTQANLSVQVGAQNLVFYEAQNLSDKAVSGHATFNVTPHKVGQYFVKTECFCFKEQILKAHEKVQMPVSFYIDPAIMDDKQLDDVENITLSYTFFKSVSVK